MSETGFDDDDDDETMLRARPDLELLSRPPLPARAGPPPPPPPPSSERTEVPPLPRPGLGSKRRKPDTQREIDRAQGSNSLPPAVVRVREGDGQKPQSGRRPVSSPGSGPHRAVRSDSARLPPIPTKAPPPLRRSPPRLREPSPVDAAASLAPLTGWPNITNELSEIRRAALEGLNDDIRGDVLVLRDKYPGHPDVDALALELGMELRQSPVSVSVKGPSGAPTHTPVMTTDELLDVDGSSLEDIDFSDLDEPTGSVASPQMKTGTDIPVFDDDEYSAGERRGSELAMTQIPTSLARQDSSRTLVPGELEVDDDEHSVTLYPGELIVEPGQRPLATDEYATLERAVTVLPSTWTQDSAAADSTGQVEPESSFPDSTSLMTPPVLIEPSHSGPIAPVRLMMIGPREEVVVELLIGIDESFEIGRDPKQPWGGDHRMEEHHARLFPCPGGLLVDDFGNASGVFTQAEEIIEVSDGDEFKVGQANLVLRMMPGAQGSWGQLIIFRHDIAEPEVHPLTQDKIMIGREHGDIILSEDTFVSGDHCRFVRNGEVVYLEDLGSSNGSYIRVRSGQCVEFGRMLLIGHTQFKVCPA